MEGTLEEMEAQEEFEAEEAPLEEELEGFNATSTSRLIYLLFIKTIITKLNNSVTTYNCKFLDINFLTETSNRNVSS